MNLNPTLVLQVDYNNGIAFEGEAAHQVMKLLSKAKVLVRETRNDCYGWHPMDPDEKFDLANRVSMISQSVEVHAKINSVQARLKEAEDRIKKHADMIEAAEALTGEEDAA
jgi:tRNA(Ser,Leu) C12 N-acetylase TAN1